jgi:hypothetical protein
MGELVGEAAETVSDLGQPEEVEVHSEAAKAQLDRGQSTEAGKPIGGTVVAKAPEPSVHAVGTTVAPSAQGHRGGVERPAHDVVGMMGRAPAPAARPVHAALASG